MQAKLSADKITVEDPELFNIGWYGKKTGSNVELSLVEAAFLLERGKIEMKMSLKEFIIFCEKEKNFMTRFSVYRDLRERGLPVRMGFKDCDFRVYDRGANANKADSIKWIVFAIAEDYSAKIDVLNKMNKLAKNIRAQALLAIVDNDSDVTYYISSEMKDL